MTKKNCQIDVRPLRCSLASQRRFRQIDGNHPVFLLHFLEYPLGIVNLLPASEAPSQSFISCLPLGLCWSWRGLVFDSWDKLLMQNLCLIISLIDSIRPYLCWYFEPFVLTDDWSPTCPASSCHIQRLFEFKLIKHTGATRLNKKLPSCQLQPDYLSIATRLPVNFLVHNHIMWFGILQGFCICLMSTSSLFKHNISLSIVMLEHPPLVHSLMQV